MSYEDSLKKLLKPFPKEYVKDAPKGKFGKYVSHSRYVERLRDSGIPYPGLVNQSMEHTMVRKESLVQKALSN